MSVDFSQLAPPDIIETLDFESILAERKASLIEKFLLMKKLKLLKP
jgi:phage-related baseplate assembly protein